MMEVNSLESAPQIHLHFLTGEAEHKDFGFGRVELCCHGCGESLLVFYDGSGKRGHMKLKKEFEAKHLKCPNHGYSNWCPNYRSEFLTADLRSKAVQAVAPLCRTPSAQSTYIRRRPGL
jgi:hypothetical protein